MRHSTTCVPAALGSLALGSLQSWTAGPMRSTVARVGAATLTQGESVGRQAGPSTREAMSRSNSHQTEHRHYALEGANDVIVKFCTRDDLAGRPDPQSSLPHRTSAS